eukprot:SAG11_NODE_683_length_7747_cov_3.047463_2_plen_221_part_00
MVEGELRRQGLEQTTRNPLSDSTFGGVIHLLASGATVQQPDPVTLVGAPAEHHQLAIAAGAYVTLDSANAFTARLRAAAAAASDERAHNAAWARFWNRSWIHVTTSPSPKADRALGAAAVNVTLVDRLNRLGFASMANSTAGHSIKFNGYQIQRIRNLQRWQPDTLLAEAAPAAVPGATMGLPRCGGHTTVGLRSVVPKCTSSLLLDVGERRCRGDEVVL